MLRLTTSDDILRYFAGGWSLSRRIADHRAKLVGRVTGTVMLQADPGSSMAQLLYQETGQMRYGNYTGRATQSYRWQIGLHHQLDVYFSDGRFFHALDLAQGEAKIDHLCAADRYVGRYQLLGPDLWRSSWKVTGPRKQMIIANLFRRQAR